jgi:hypothetical protein
MTEIQGDLWDHIHAGYIVITTNGYVNSKGKCTMGRGNALQAAQRYPELPKLLGTRIEEDGNHLFEFVLGDVKILTFPVKVMWWEPAKQWLIQRSCKELLMFIGNRDVNVFIPRAGCMNGQLDWLRQVRPIYEQEFGGDERIVVVDRRG